MGEVKRCIHMEVSGSLECTVEEESLVVDAGVGQGESMPVEDGHQCRTRGNGITSSSLPWKRFILESAKYSNKSFLVASQ